MKETDGKSTCGKFAASAAVVNVTAAILAMAPAPSRADEVNPNDGDSATANAPSVCADKVFFWGYVLDKTPSACPFMMGKTDFSLERATGEFKAKHAIYMNSMFNREYVLRHFQYWDRECFVNCIDNRLSDAPLPLDYLKLSVTAALDAVADGTLDDIILPQVAWYSAPSHREHYEWLREKILSLE